MNCSLVVEDFLTDAVLRDGDGKCKNPSCMKSVGEHPRKIVAISLAKDRAFDNSRHNEDRMDTRIMLEGRSQEERSEVRQTDVSDCNQEVILGIQHVCRRGNLIAIRTENTSAYLKEGTLSQTNIEAEKLPPLPARFTFKNLRMEPYKWYRLKGWGLIPYIYVHKRKPNGEKYAKSEIKARLIEGKDYFGDEDAAFKSAIAFYGQEEDSEQDESDPEASPVAVRFFPETNHDHDTTAETVEISDDSDLSESDSEEDYEDPYGAEEDYNPKKRKSGIKDGKLLGGGISKLYTRKKRRGQVHYE